LKIGSLPHWSESNGIRQDRSRQLGLLYDPNVSDLLHISVDTLKSRRAPGDAPPSAQFGAQRITTIDDLRRWIAKPRVP
jgi:hypothetical protein